MQLQVSGALSVSTYTFSAGWKEQVSHHHPHHILQGHHWECADQLHHCLVRELQCCWPQGLPADSEHGCKDHRCPSPIHPGHFPCTMLQQNQQHHEGPTHLHSLFQLLPSGRRYRSIRAHSARLLNSFFPQAVRALNSDHPAPLWNPMQTPTSWNMDHPPPPSKHPPTLPHQRKKTVWNFFCAIQSVLHTGEWACTNHL